MPLRFCANLSFLYNECGSLLERYAAAAASGFRFVECAQPYEFPIDDVVKAKTNANVQQVLINIYSPPGFAMGCAALADCKDKFADSLEQSIKYAKALQCSRIHVTAGSDANLSLDMPDVYSVYEKNLQLAAKRFQEENIIGLVEPINSITVPGYLMSNFKSALNIVKKLNTPHMRLQLDFFHLQIMCGNLTNHVKEFLPYVGHIQIAQVPDRHEPDTRGEIDYPYVFNLLEKLNYDGWIGLEYKPESGDTAEGLKRWLKKYDYSL